MGLSAHGAQSAHDDFAIDPVQIADEVVRSLIPRKTSFETQHLKDSPRFRQPCSRDVFV
jgi:hypothetical protein